MAHNVSIYMLVYVDLAGDKYNRYIQTGVLIFINKDYNHCNINSKVTVEASNFGSDFWAMKSGVEIVEALGKIYENLDYQ